MPIAHFLSSIFRYRKTNVSILFVATYLLIGFIYLSDQIRYKYTVPSSDSNIPIRSALDISWNDLQNITFSYHPYTSRDNDRVHDYLLERVVSITSNTSYAQISDDMENKATNLFKQDDVFNASSTVSRVIYFESSNILVKLAGKDPTLPGLLLSAHFDSVPTSHGATDDGKGIASMLALLEYYSKNQPRRTIVFNFNNNEEFGLLGATQFFQHEWSRIVHYFINLEGTGTGSKSILFRTSDASTAKIFKDAVQVEPFGNSIFQQGFNRRVISSETDYKVYSMNGLRGWDIAFYKPRDLYHTKYDDIVHTTREALWHMLFTSWQLSEHITKMDTDAHYNLEPAVYFDFAGLKFFTISARALFVTNCSILILFPVILFSLYIITKKRHLLHETSWSVWWRLPIALCSTIFLIKILQYVMKSVNPFIMFRDCYSAFFTFVCAILFVNVFIFSLFEYLNPSDDFKDICFIELCLLFWTGLAFMTYILYSSDYDLTGIYLLTLVFICISLCVLIKLLAALTYENQKSESSQNIEELSESQGYGTINDEPENDEESLNDDAHSGRDRESDNEENIGDERAPLIPQPNQNNRSNEMPSNTSTTKEKFQYEWLLQFLIIVPVLALCYQSVLLSLSAIAQTVVESNRSATFVWNLMVYCSVFVCLLHLPFLKIRGWLIVSLLLVFLGSLVKSLWISPFTSDTPLKVRFKQRTDGLIELSGIGNNTEYLETLIADLPSYKSHREQFYCKETSCSYYGLRPNPIDTYNDSEKKPLTSITIVDNNRKDENRSIYAPIEAILKINAQENRACNLFFNSSANGNSKVKQVTIYDHDSNEVKEKFRWGKGIDELQLHKLNFTQPYYYVGIQWFPKILSNEEILELENSGTDEDKLGVSVVCYWGEFDSDTFVNGKHLRKVPALDELLLYAPQNYSFTNREKGLVYSHEYIEL